MKDHIIYQRLYGMMLMSSFIFFSDALSLKGKKLDFYGRGDTYASLTNTIPELSRFTACIDLVYTAVSSTNWMAFSYMSKNTFLGKEDIDLGLAGNYQQLILYNLGKILYIPYHLKPLKWHTICLIWDGVKGKLELFLNNERIVVIWDQPQNLTPNGTLVVGHFLKNGDRQVKSMVPSFTGSLYYFQLWDHILEKDEFMKCLHGNVVSWEEDVWLINKIIPTGDWRLRCFVSKNITIEGTSTALSQQIDLTTPSQITRLTPEKTVYSSTIVSKSMPVFATDYTIRSYSDTTSPTLETMTATKNFKTSIAETATLATDILSTSAAITLPTKSTSIGTSANSMETTSSPSSESTRTTKMAQVVATETFHPTAATDFLFTSGFTKNSVVSKTSATRSHSAIIKTTSLFSSIDSRSISMTSWPKHKSTDIGVLPISTAGQVFLASTAAGTVPWSTVEQASATANHIGTALTVTPESVLISTAAVPVDSVFPKNQTASSLSTTDMPITFTVHSVMLPTRPIGTTPVLKTAETELTSMNFQDVSSPRVEDAVSTSATKEAFSMALSFGTSSPFIGDQSAQTIIDAETTHTTLTPEITLAPTVAKPIVSSTITKPLYTEKRPTPGGTMLPLISTRLASTPKASESVFTEAAHIFSTNKTTWTSRPDQSLLAFINTSTKLAFLPNENFTSAIHGSTSNAEHSSTIINSITPPEVSIDSEVTTAADAIITGSARYTTLSKLTPPWFANFSTVSGTTSVPKPTEFKLITSLLKTTPMTTVAVNELPSTPRETAVPPADMQSTLANIKQKFSTEVSPSETSQTETNGTIAFGETTASVPKSMTTQRFSATMTRKETTSHYLKGKSPTAVTLQISPFSTMLETTDESAQTLTASATNSPLPDIEKTSVTLDNKTVTTEERENWLLTKSVKTTPKNSYNGTIEIINSTHTYTARWNSGNPLEGDSAPPPTSGSTQTFPIPLGVSTTRILGTVFTTTPSDNTTTSLSAGILLPQPKPTHSPATPLPVTHMFSLPLNTSAVTSMVVSNEATVSIPESSTLARAFSPSVFSDVSTLSSVNILSGQTASTTNDTMLPHRDSILTTSEATVISVRMTPMTIPSLTETPVPSLRTPTPMATKAETTLPSTSSDIVTPPTHNLTCSASLPETPLVSSTHVASTTSTPVATQPTSQVVEATMLERSTHALSFPSTLSGGADVVSLSTGTTETSADENRPLHTSANDLTTSVEVHISQSSTHLVNTPPTLHVTGSSTLSSEKEQMTTSVENISRTIEVKEMSPSKNSISYSQGASSLEMTDTELSESTKSYSHQTHSPSGILLETSPEGNSASSPISGSAQTTAISTSNDTVGVHVSEMSNSLGKTALPSQTLANTTFLTPEKESTSAFSVYTSRSGETIVRSTSVTHPVSYSQDMSSVDITPSKINRVSNPMNINTTLSYLPSLRTQTEMTSIASPISGSTQASPVPLSLSTDGLSKANFTVTSSDSIATDVSAPNIYTTLLGKTSMVTSITTSQISSLPVNVTAFISQNVLDTSTTLMTKSKTTPSGCLKSPSIATYRPMSERSSLPVNDSAFSPAMVSSDTSTTVGLFSTLLSSITPRTTTTIQTSALDITPMTYEGTLVSSAFTTSEMTELSSRITPTSFSSLTEAASSVKTVPTIVTSGIATPFMSNTASSLLSSKNTEALFSNSKTTFSPILTTTQQPSQGDDATALGILPGITHSSLSSVSTGVKTAFISTYSRTVGPENVLSPTLSDNLHTSKNIQFSPPLTSFKSTPGPTESVKATIHLSCNTGKMTSLSENTSLTAKLTKSALSVNTPVSDFPRTPSISSLTSSLYSPYSTGAEFFTLKTSLPLTSHVVELPVAGTGTTSNDTQSLLMTSWNTPTAEDSQFPISTSTHIAIPNKMEAATLYLVSGSLPTFTPSQTSLVSGDVMTMPSTPTSGILPGFSESSSLSTSSRTIPTTLADIKHTFEKITTSVTPGTTLPLNPSGATSGSIISNATTTSPMLTWISSSLPSGSPLATVSKAPQVIASSSIEESKSTFPTSDVTPTHPFIKFTTLPFATISPIPSKTTPTTKMDDNITGFQTSLPVSIKITNDSIYISPIPGASSRVTVTANSRNVPQPLTFSRMNTSPVITDHTLSNGSMSMTHPTVTSAWSRIPAASTFPTLVLPKPTMSPLPNVTTTSTATGASFPLLSTEVTHHSTVTLSSIISSSFEKTWLESTSSFMSIETSTSPIAKSTVSFYNIEMKFSVFDEESRILMTSVMNEFAENWLNSIFQDNEFSLANLSVQIKSRDTFEDETTLDQASRKGQGMTTISSVPYSCECQVIIKANSSLVSTELISRIKSKIHGNLAHGNFTQDQLTLLVKSEHVTVKKLEPGKCKASETASKYKGTYKWLPTNPTETAHTRCIKNEDGNAIRICSISIKTGKSHWEKPKFKQCKLLQGLPDKIVDLANITISDENADDVAEHILNLINESPPLDKKETEILVSKVSEISQCDEISMNLTQIILQIISAVLEKQNDSVSDLHEVSNEILRIIERAGHKMEFWGRTANVTVAGLALAVLQMDHMFEGMVFSIGSYEEGTAPEIYLGTVLLGKALASIYLPKSLKERIPLNKLRTILFNFFGQTSLFKTENLMKALTTYVVSASISDMSIQNLADPVVITLQHIEGNQNYDQVHCTFWDFEKNNGLGGWNSSGCKVKETNINYTVCQCDHLTHFGVLMDLSRSAVDAVNERILVLITYAGCGISSIFLGISIATYLAFPKLRKDYPSKILINLCTALLMLNLAFLVNSWSSFQKAELCITAAVALHYFLLVSFTWMGLEAVHMYFALVKVFNIYIPNYILKFCLVGWGIPAITVAIILSVKRDLYGTLNPSTAFCWIKDDSIFYISVVAYFCLIFLMNLSMFCIVIAQVNSMKSQSQKTRRKMILHDLKSTTSLTFLLGLTWGLAFFAWGPVKILFLYLFAIFNTLQGFLIFVFHCMMKESVREQWQVHLCHGWLQLNNSSDGSSRYGLNVGYKQERLNKTFEHKLLTPSLKSTATSSTFKSLCSAQSTPSDISFPNDDFDEDPYCFSPLDYDVVHNCVRRMLPVEIKMNSTHPQRLLQ